MQKKHFFLGNKIAEVRSFTPRTRSVQPPTMPERNRQEHAAYIKEIYNTAIDKAIETLSQRSEMLMLPYISKKKKKIGWIRRLMSMQMKKFAQ